MKKLAIALAVTALAASPALAKSKQQQKSAAAPQADSYNTQSDEAYAYAPQNGATNAPGMRPGVYQYGVYQGWDPDPNIRFQLLRVPNGQNVD